ncbi:MAG: hypothetical protein SFV15_07935 [Polyangiaceae bacterium]|nr:hypothetical protein [Polyangiaceae bacterium]
MRRANIRHRHHCFGVLWVGLLVILAAGCDDRGEVLSAITPAASLPMRIRRVAAGTEHACAVKDSVLLCWGKNDHGQVGGGAASEWAPRVLVTATEWQDVVAGGGSSCGLSVGGEVWCWGDNSQGQLGTSDFEKGLAPRKAALPGPVSSIALKFNHACAVLKDESLWCWGENTEGQLGLGGVFPGAPEPSPREVPSVDGGWVGVATGQGHTCAIGRTGALWCWGRNTEGELGSGGIDPGQIRVPNQVGVATDWREVAAGQSYSCGIRGAGELWCWGGDMGQLGLGLSMQTLSLPTRVTMGTDFRQLALDTFHTCVQRSTPEGNLWCWGRSIEGQLGVSDPTPRSLPAPFNSLLTWEAVAVGRFFTCGWQRDAGLFCTGENNSGQLGVGDVERRSVPTLALAAP